MVLDEVAGGANRYQRLIRTRRCTKLGKRAIDRASQATVRRAKQLDADALQQISEFRPVVNARPLRRDHMQLPSHDGPM